MTTIKEDNIPYEMRYKVCCAYKEILYWVTQEPFTQKDLKQFIEEFKNTNFDDCILTTRDFSCYDMINDIQNKSIIRISKDYENTTTYDDTDYKNLMKERNWKYE